MSWILREGLCKLSITERFTLSLLGVCPHEEKSPFWNARTSSPDRLRNAFSFENRAIHPNLHRQTPLFTTTSRIEYP